MRASLWAVRAELRARPFRAALCVIAAAVSVLGLTTASVASEALAGSFTAAERAYAPADLTFRVGSVGASTLDLLRRIPPVSRLEVRAATWGEWRTGTGFLAVELIGLPSGAEQHIDRPTIISGRFPRHGQILLDSSAGAPSGAHVGQRVQLVISGRRYTLTVSGFARTPGASSVNWSDRAINHMRLDDLRWLAGSNASTILNFRLRSGSDRTLAARAVARVLKDQGVSFYSWQIGPDRSNRRVTDDLIATIRAISALVLAFAAIGTALLAAAVRRQLAPGGAGETRISPRPPVLGLPLHAAATCSVLGSAMGLVIGFITGDVLTRYIASLFTLDVHGITLNRAAVLAGPAAGILIPLLAAAVATHGGTASDTRGTTMRLTVRWVRHMVVAAALREQLRLPRRLFFPLGMLTLAGAVLLALWTTAASFHAFAAGQASAFHADAIVQFPEPVPFGIVRSVAVGSGVVRHVEPFEQTQVQTRWGIAALVGVTASTRLYDRRLVTGRWLRSGETAAVVLDARAASRSHLLPGDSISVDDGLHTGTYRVVGISSSEGGAGVSSNPLGSLLVSAGEANSLLGQPPGTVNAILITINPGVNRTDSLEKLRLSLKSSGWSATVLTPSERVHKLEGQLAAAYSVLYSIIVLSGILAIVACFDLLVPDTREERRQIAILRILGATNAAVSLTRWVAGAALGGVSLPFSLVCGGVLSVIVHRLLSRTVIDLPYSLPVTGIPLVVVLLLALMAPGAALASALAQRVDVAAALEDKCHSV